MLIVGYGLGRALHYPLQAELVLSQSDATQVRTGVIEHRSRNRSCGPSVTVHRARLSKEERKEKKKCVGGGEGKGGFHLGLRSP